MASTSKISWTRICWLLVERVPFSKNKYSSVSRYLPTPIPVRGFPIADHNVPGSRDGSCLAVTLLTRALLTFEKWLATPLWSRC